MHVVCRWLLISFLIMALPLKGLAAVGYLGCDPRHAPSAAMAHAHPSGQDEAHDHAGMQDEVSAQALEPKADTGTSSEQLPIKAALKCTQCAPCCGAAAPPCDAPLLLSLAGPTEPKVTARLLEPRSTLV
jgi:hypothetical protein